MNTPATAAAFPVKYDNGFTHAGMSLRDYFAAKALGGLATSQDANGTWRHGDAKTLASTAYEIADAMLAERAKNGSQSC